jgi:hypothetical protein
LYDEIRNIGLPKNNTLILFTLLNPAEREFAGRIFNRVKKYPTKAPYQKTSDKKQSKITAKIFSSRENTSFRSSVHLLPRNFMSKKRKKVFGAARRF